MMLAPGKGFKRRLKILGLELEDGKKLLGGLPR